jgi:hypothetical protein
VSSCNELHIFTLHFPFELLNANEYCQSAKHFNIHGSVHRNNILIYIQQDATLHSLFYLETALHVSGGTTTHHQERKQLSIASGIRHTVTATCRYRQVAVTV